MDPTTAGRLSAREEPSKDQGYRWRLMAPEMNQVLWRQSLEMHLRAARIHEDAAERFTRIGNFASATRAAEFAAAERRAHAEALVRHPVWAP